MEYFLAIDIGASSGRHIVGWKEDGLLRTREVYRFPNGVIQENGHLCWDVKALLQEVICGIRRAFCEYPGICSLSIDTWAVDYVLLRSNQELLPVYAYRDSRTESVIAEVHKKIPFPELYHRTGCQFQPFNSIYQLADDLRRGRLDGATDLLMLPEYLLYKLTGVKVREYTNATTTGLVNAESGEYDAEILKALGLPEGLFPKLSHPGTVLGNLLPEVQKLVGGNCRVVLCATHDTASAVEGIPMSSNSPYISSGTWSLLGVKTMQPITTEASRKSNFSNEGGVGYNRYQKNIMGMWLINSLHRELCPEVTIKELIEAAEKSTCREQVDANAAEFLAPESMKEAFDRQLGHSLPAAADYIRCACLSLAECYRSALEVLEKNTLWHYQKLYIVGGGARNAFLNRLIEQATGKIVCALPIEATALGNLNIQMEVNKV